MYHENIVEDSLTEPFELLAVLVPELVAEGEREGFLTEEVEERLMLEGKGRDGRLRSTHTHKHARMHARTHTHTHLNLLNSSLCFSR